MIMRQFLAMRCRSASYASNSKKKSLWLLNLVWDILVFLNFRFAIFLRIWFLFRSNLHFQICFKSVQNLAIVWRFLSHCLGMHAFLTSTWHIYITVSNLVMRCYHLHIWPPDDTTCASCKVGHLMEPLAIVTKLSTRWRHLHWFQIWPPAGANCISCKFAHQMAPQRTRFVLTES